MKIDTDGLRAAASPPRTRRARRGQILATVLALVALSAAFAPQGVCATGDPDAIRAQNVGLVSDQQLPDAEKGSFALTFPITPLPPLGGLSEAPPQATDIPEFPTLEDLEVEARLERLAKLPPSLGLDIVRTGLTQKGRRYRRAGTSPATGFDCSGFVQWTFKQHGVNVPRSAAEQFQAGRVLRQSDLRPGDLVFYKINRRRWHVGIYMEDDTFVHSPRPGRGISEAYMHDPYWSKRYIGARRLVE